MYSNELSDSDLDSVVGGGEGDVEKKECTTTRKKLDDGTVIETTVCVIKPKTPILD
jgi:hypothetical protein